MHSKLKYYYNLDGLRALAAFGVIVAHFFSSEILKDQPVLLKIANLGNSGVSLFFVLSGFVITRILINSLDSSNYFKAFYFRRTLRIFPLYYFALVCYYILPFLFLGRPDIPDFSSQLPFWVYLQNFARTFHWKYSGPGHYWSLAVEEHFYLIWPTVVYFLYRKNKKLLFRFSIFLYFLTLVIRYIMLKDGYEIDVFTFTRMDQLVLGCILALMEYRGLLTKKSLNFFGVCTITGLVLVAYVSSLDYFYLNLIKHNAFGLLYFGLIGFVIVSAHTMIFNRFLKK